MLTGSSRLHPTCVMFTICNISVYVCRSLLDSGLRSGGRGGLDNGLHEGRRESDWGTATFFPCFRMNFYTIKN